MNILFVVNFLFIDNFQKKKRNIYRKFFRNFYMRIFYILFLFCLWKILLNFFIYRKCICFLVNILLVFFRFGEQFDIIIWYMFTCKYNIFIHLLWCDIFTHFNSKLLFYIYFVFWCKAFQNCTMHQSWVNNLNLRYWMYTECYNETFAFNKKFFSICVLCISRFKI